MACMCGDTHCSSCGPAQGNWKCPICGSWADDGCDHIDGQRGKLKTEFEQQAEEKWLQEKQAEEEYWRQVVAEEDAQ